MKKVFLLLSFSAILAGSALVSCGNETKKNEPAPDPMMKKADDSTAQAAYICPMGASCGSGDAPGKCAGCGMDLVKNEKHKP